MTNLNSVPSETVGELISTRGSIIHAGETEFITEVLCYRCSTCSALMAVRQMKKEEKEKFLEPQSCTGNCRGDLGMDALYDSPFTFCYSRQVVTIQTISHNVNQTNRPIEVVLYRELTDAFAVGQEVIVTGIVKQVVEDSGDDENIKFKSIFTKKKDKETNPIILKTYLKCFSMIESFNEDQQKESVINDGTPEMEMCITLRSDPRIFKIILHSFCPHINGKEVAKAFTLLGVFGGHGLMKNHRRSSIHILLLGSTGTGKSAILQAAYEIAPKGMAISGANITLAGLTAACSEHMVADAGAIALCDNGVLDIDELDKMEREQQQTLVSCMDSGVISIHKNGSFFKMNVREIF
jgi:DNA helicase MCM8